MLEEAVLYVKFLQLQIKVSITFMVVLDLSFLGILCDVDVSYQKGCFMIRCSVLTRCGCTRRSLTAA